MITSKFISRLTALFATVFCLFILIAAVNAQDAAPAANPAPDPANKPAAAPAAKPAQPTTATKPAADKPLSFRFREFENPEEDRIRNQTGTIINKGKFEKEDKALFIQYYKEYFFARWVNSGKYYQMESYAEGLRKQAKAAKKSPNERKKLEAIASRWNYPCFIEDFRKDLDRSREDGEPQRIAVKIAYDFALEVIASNNSHCTPAVKYNCILLLGNLYYKTSSTDLPVVYAPAFDLLIKIASGTKSPRYMKIGAVMALNQMIAETKLSDKQKSDAYNVLLGIAKVKVEPSTYASSKDDPSGEGALWTRNLAIEGLRLLADFNPKVDKTKGFYPPGKETIGVLFQILNDKSSPMTTRIAALESLGSYNFGKYPELKTIAPKILKSSVSLTIEAIQMELDRKVDNLIWGDDSELLSNQYNQDGAENEPVDNTNNAVFLLQRAMPAVYALNVALSGVKSDKGWKGLSDLGSPDDKARVGEITGVLRDANSSLNALAKEIMPSSDSSNAVDMDSDDSYATDKLQEVISALNTIQDDLKPYTE